ncbi:MAG: hypothetical protein WCL39_15535, partial [Armatimonadota bacterium]
AWMKGNRFNYRHIVNCRSGGSIQHPRLLGDAELDFGVSGGRRNKERETTHYAATIDDLLNRASQDCTKMKLSKQSAQREESVPQAIQTFSPATQIPSTPSSQRRLKIVEVAFNSRGIDASIRVKLSLGDVIYESHMSGFSSSRSVIRLAAETCASAVRSALPKECQVAIEDSSEFTLPGGEDVIVSTVVLATQTETTVTHGLAAVAAGDIYRAAVASVLSALNRPLRLE